MPVLVAESLVNGLSITARQYLEKHPRKAIMAVRAALETAAAQAETSKAVGIPPHLQQFVVQRPNDGSFISITEAAERLQVARNTVYDWSDKKILLAWRGTKRGLVIPGEQIMGPGQVAPGIQQVLEAIPDPELAWAFLSQEWAFADKVERPIDRLKRKDVAPVVDAAPSFGSSFT